MKKRSLIQPYSATMEGQKRRVVVALWEINFYSKFLLFHLFWSVLLLSSCSIFKDRDTRSALKIKREIANSLVFSNAFTGFTLLDPSEGRTLVEYNSNRYFTPASNTKILTLATCLEVLKDSVPGLQVIQLENASIYRGTGDPTFLNPAFSSWQSVFQKFKADSLRQRFVITKPIKDVRLGPGWAWDDATNSFSPERSDLPIYGGLITIYNHSDSTKRRVDPPFFQPMFIEKQVLENYPFGLYSNHYYLWPETRAIDTIQTPIANASSLARFLLMDTVSAGFEAYSIETIQKGFEKARNWRTLYSTPMDTVLRRMMHQSDNFIAEQMLMVSAGVKFDQLKQDTMIQWMLDSVLTELPQRPKWVDGSGLSRYNLMTPKSIALVLQKLWKEQSRERLFSLFPAGGVSGTISDRYAGKDHKPYVYAKTGGMSGVQCLSGYVVCKSGKVLIFSFMHNNIVGSSRAWKEEMQRILEALYTRF